ncbi:hypothetical protein [Pseudomonas putida]|uniref:Uncharacterized protein n=1 Tax=Pseudomonas putida TaxID=303 RepID=A0A8I1ECD0_PSEPU|nr:hypothetical protein [Pseudomonas putida]MBI6882694.1 hypothetical protein [Pseudomonas putida]
MNREIEQQQKIVREAYAKTNSLNPEYEAEFDKLSDMRAKADAKTFRKARGLHHEAETPYCR